MSLDRIIPGYLENHVDRGLRMVFMVAVSREDGEAILDALGFKPDRARGTPVCLALGPAAAALGEMRREIAGHDLATGLHDVASADPIAPEGPDIAAGVALVAQLTVDLQLWTDTAAGSRGPARAMALEHRDETAARLRVAQDDLNAEFRGAIAAGGRVG